jgi:hypothetical protein
MTRNVYLFLQVAYLPSPVDKENIRPLRCSGYFSESLAFSSQGVLSGVERDA